MAHPPLNWRIGNVGSVEQFIQSRDGWAKTAAEITANIALGVIPPDEECARAAVFLASDMASMVTGQAIDVNGGEVFH